MADETRKGITPINPSFKKTDTIKDVTENINRINPEFITPLQEDESGSKYISVKLLRPQDLLFMELRFKNYHLSGNQLIRNSDPAWMMVVFQPQSMAEQAGTEDAAVLKMPADLPANMLVSSTSRLVFKTNRNFNVDVNDLLNWNDLELVVSPRAKGVPGNDFVHVVLQPHLNELIKDPTKISITQIGNLKGLTKSDNIALKQRLFQADDNIHLQDQSIKNVGNIQQRSEVTGGIKPVITPGKIDPLTKLGETVIKLAEPVSPPATWETSLEIPFRLFLSPTKSAAWCHEKKLNVSKGVLKETNSLYELWHTRMAARTTHGIDDSDLGAEERLLRILWGEQISKKFDEVPPEAPDAFLGITSASDSDRHQLVHESSNFSIPNFTPQPVKANKLFLTTLGAWLDSTFAISPAELPKGLAKTQWRHIQTLGREHYVKIVTTGYVMPFGHRAVLLKITERKPHQATLTATNFQRFVVVITEPVKHYDYRVGTTFMNFCFSQIEILTTSTPPLDPLKAFADGAPAGEQFVIKVGSKQMEFKMRGEDLNGNISNFSLPLVFVSKTAIDIGGFITKAFSTYMQAVPPVNRNADFKAQKVSLAPFEHNGCDTAFPSSIIEFGVQVDRVPVDEPQGFLPTIIRVNITEPSYQRLTGITNTVPVTLFNDDNPGHVFATFDEERDVNFAGNADKTGGFALPNFTAKGLSKAAGVFGGTVKAFKDGMASEKEFFGPTTLPDPVLFGVFKLSDILKFPAGGDSYSLAAPLANRVTKIPNLTTEDNGKQLITSYVMKPDVKAWSLEKVVSFTPGASTSFTIVTQTIVDKKDPTTPAFSTVATLRDFDIILIDGLINIGFDQVQFTSSPGKSADVNVNMRNPALVFGGPLTFINAFQKLIPPAGFSDPPYLDVSPTGVKCGYTLTLPSLQLGAFTLSNLSLGADVNLPFTGAPLVMGFHFCEKQQPFTLTVSLLGGGGYFGFEADLHGLRQIDAALEFGAAVALNLGVASGAVSIMAGIYFKITFTDEGENSTQLTGYLRINGAMSILGLITASIELYMAFTYLADKHKAYGEASVSIKVHVLFFSKTVTVHTSRTFAGSGSDPNLIDTYSLEKWGAYWDAFAA